MRSSWTRTSIPNWSKRASNWPVESDLLPGMNPLNPLKMTLSFQGNSALSRLFLFWKEPMKDSESVSARQSFSISLSTISRKFAPRISIIIGVLNMVRVRFVGSISRSIPKWRTSTRIRLLLSKKPIWPPKSNPSFTRIWAKVEAKGARKSIDSGPESMERWSWIFSICIIWITTCGITLWKPISIL